MKNSPDIVDNAALSSGVVLSVRNVSKKFCRNLKRSMIYGMGDLARGLVGRPLSCEQLRDGEFWALDDVSFDLKRGETLGIIGENGSGKSTLLRVLTGIFPPDRGEVAFRGRIGGLIALGAGMHPHMTGMENVFLNGSILGMTRDEIAQKCDAIVEFAEIGEFIHAPLSTYSSGMRVRLGFAVAIHAEPDILLLDEVLAVGDLNFQRKCFQKLEQLRGTERSCVIISHDLRQIERMCDRAIVLHDGKAMGLGPTTEIVDGYFRTSMKRESQGGDALDSKKNDVAVAGIQLLDAVVCDARGERTTEVVTGHPFTVRLRFKADQPLSMPFWSIGLVTADMLVVGGVSSEFDASRRDMHGEFDVHCRFRRCPLLPGTYSIRIKVRDATTALLLVAERRGLLCVVGSGEIRHGLDRSGLICLDVDWSQERVLGM